MRYCLKYSNICKHLKDADEISIKYIEDRGLVDFMNKYANKRIILLVDSKSFPDSEINKLIAIKKTYPDLQFAVCLNEYSEGLIEVLQKANLAFFSLKPVHTWELLWKLVEVDGVSDINLSGALAFEIPKVKKYLDSLDRKVNIRLTPNLISSEFPQVPQLVQFFIRPDDIDLYEPYADIIEFEGVENQDQFYNIYAKQKMFYGKLNQVIYNFEEPIDNKSLIPAFTERRISCGRECLRGGRCKRCYTLADISKKISPYVTEKIKENIKKQVGSNDEAN